MSASPNPLLWCVTSASKGSKPTDFHAGNKNLLFPAELQLILQWPLYAMLRFMGTQALDGRGWQLGADQIAFRKVAPSTCAQLALAQFSPLILLAASCLPHSCLPGLLTVEMCLERNLSLHVQVGPCQRDGKAGCTVFVLSVFRMLRVPSTPCNVRLMSRRFGHSCSPTNFACADCSDVASACFRSWTEATYGHIHVLPRGASCT